MRYITATPTVVHRSQCICTRVSRLDSDARSRSERRLQSHLLQSHPCNWSIFGESKVYIRNETTVPAMGYAPASTQRHFFVSTFIEHEIETAAAAAAGECVGDGAGLGVRLLLGSSRLPRGTGPFEPTREFSFVFRVTVPLRGTSLTIRWI